MSCQVLFLYTVWQSISMKWSSGMAQVSAGLNPIIANLKYVYPYSLSACSKRIIPSPKT